MGSALRVKGSVALLLGSILVAALVRFALVASVDAYLFDLSLTIRFMKTVK